MEETEVLKKQTNNSKISEVICLSLQISVTCRALEIPEILGGANPTSRGRIIKSARYWVLFQRLFCITSFSFHSSLLLSALSLFSYEETREQRG